MAKQNLQGPGLEIKIATKGGGGVGTMQVTRPARGIKMAAMVEWISRSREFVQFLEGTALCEHLNKRNGLYVDKVHLAGLGFDCPSAWFRII